MAVGGALIPSRVGVAQDCVLRGSEQPPHNLQAYLVGLEYAKPTPMIRRYWDAAAILEAAWQRVIWENVNPRQGMEEILGQLSSLLP